MTTGHGGGAEGEGLVSLSFLSEKRGRNRNTRKSCAPVFCLYGETTPAPPPSPASCRRRLAAPLPPATRAPPHGYVGGYYDGSVERRLPVPGVPALPGRLEGRGATACHDRIRPLRNLRLSGRRVRGRVARRRRQARRRLLRRPPHFPPLLRRLRGSNS